jgi:hypothetical protein
LNINLSEKERPVYEYIFKKLIRLNELKPILNYETKKPLLSKNNLFISGSGVKLENKIIYN